MPIQLKEEDGGRILAICANGKLLKADYAGFVPTIDRTILLHGRLKVLLDLSGFSGWDLVAVWEELKVCVKYFNKIDQMAMIGETRWQEEMAAIFRPFTTATVKYFDHAEADEARKWLSQNGGLGLAGNE